MNSYQLKRYKPILLSKFNHKCAKCGAEEDLQIDHILAKSLGGATDEENLQILCGICNRKKGGKKSPGSPKKQKDGLFIRKEFNLGEGTIGRLQILADRKKWSLKKYMENVLEINSKKAMEPLLEKLKKKLNDRERI